MSLFFTHLLITIHYFSTKKFRKMKKNQLLILLVIFFAGCAPVYVPNALNTPMFEEKGDINASFYGGTSGTDFQLSYAVTDNILVLANGSFARRDSTDDTDFHEHTYGEAGVGFYSAFGKNGRSETIIGYGMGKASAEGDFSFIGLDKYLITGTYRRFFLQGNVGFGSEGFDGGLAIRASYLTFYDLKHGNEDYDEEKMTGFFAEPVLFLRAGWKYVKLQTQIGFSYPFSKSTSLGYQPFMFSFGVNVNLNVFDDLM